MKLGEILVQRGLVSQKDIQRALEKQQQRGGKLGTNLVALRLVSEETLAKILGEQVGLPCAKSKDFEDVPMDIIQLVSPELADLYSFIPLAKNTNLVVATSDVLHGDLQERLFQTVGLPVQVTIAPEIWVTAALERYYNLSRTWRFLQNEEDVVSSPQLRLHSFLTKTGPERTREESFYREFLDGLSQSENLRDMVNLTCSELWPFYPRQVVMALGDLDVEGWVTYGFPVHSSLFRELRIPLKEAPVFRNLSERKSEFFGNFDAFHQEKTLFDFLGIFENTPVEIFPVLSFGKVVALWIGFSSQSHLDSSSLKEIRWILHKLGLGLALWSMKNELYK